LVKNEPIKWVGIFTIQTVISKNKFMRFRGSKIVGMHNRPIQIIIEIKIQIVIGFGSEIEIDRE